MARPTDDKTKRARVEELLRLIDRHPEVIEVNITKLMRVANLPYNNYPIIRKTWLAMRGTVKFKRV